MQKEQLWAVGREKVLAASQLYIDVDVKADGIAGYGSMVSIGAQSPTGESFYSEIRPYSKKFLKKSKLPPEILPDGDFTHHALEDAQYQQKIHFGLAALLGTRYDRIANPSE